MMYNTYSNNGDDGDDDDYDCNYDYIKTCQQYHHHHLEFTFPQVILHSLQCIGCVGGCCSSNCCSSGG